MRSAGKSGWLFFILHQKILRFYKMRQKFLMLNEALSTNIVGCWFFILFEAVGEKERKLILHVMRLQEGILNI